MDHGFAHTKKVQKPDKQLGDFLGFKYFSESSPLDQYHFYCVWLEWLLWLGGDSAARLKLVKKDYDWIFPNFGGETIPIIFKKH